VLHTKAVHPWSEDDVDDAADAGAGAAAAADDDGGGGGEQVQTVGTNFTSQATRSGSAIRQVRKRTVLMRDSCKASVCATKSGEP
jgi:hypothetical protein